jgi:hypothetical protein
MPPAPSIYVSYRHTASDCTMTTERTTKSFELMLSKPFQVPMDQLITKKSHVIMMNDSEVSIEFWGEAVNTAVYLNQRYPSISKMHFSHREPPGV